MLSRLSQFTEFLFPRVEPRRDADEAYLAEAVDLYDLEQRMRRIDRPSRESSPALVFALGLR